MNSSSEELLKLIKNLKFDEAISHSLHSRIFEILGYISIIKKEKIPNEVLSYLNSIEELNKKLIEEIHLIIESYKNSNQKS